jgi:hypothetical protein
LGIEELTIHILGEKVPVRVKALKETHYLPRSTFITGPEASEAVLRFLQTGEVDRSSLWMRRSEIWWPDIDE